MKKLLLSLIVLFGCWAASVSIAHAQTNAGDDSSVNRDKTLEITKEQVERATDFGFPYTESDTRDYMADFFFGMIDDSKVSEDSPIVPVMANDGPLRAAFTKFLMLLVSGAGVLIIYNLIAFLIKAGNMGQSASRETNIPVFAGRILASVMLIVPVFNGFALVQIIVLIVAAQSSLFATEVWNAFSSSLLKEQAQVQRALNATEIIDAETIVYDTAHQVLLKSTCWVASHVEDGDDSDHYSQLDDMTGENLYSFVPYVAVKDATAGGDESKITVVKYSFNFGAKCGSFEMTYKSNRPIPAGFVLPNSDSNAENDFENIVNENTIAEQADRKLFIDRVKLVSSLIPTAPVVETLSQPRFQRGTHPKSMAATSRFSEVIPEPDSLTNQQQGLIVSSGYHGDLNADLLYEAVLERHSGKNHKCSIDDPNGDPAKFSKAERYPSTRGVSPCMIEYYAQLVDILKKEIKLTSDSAVEIVYCDGDTCAGEGASSTDNASSQVSHHGIGWLGAGTYYYTISRIMGDMHSYYTNPLLTNPPLPFSTLDKEILQSLAEANTAPVFYGRKMQVNSYLDVMQGERLQIAGGLSGSGDWGEAAAMSTVEAVTSYAHNDAAPLPSMVATGYRMMLVGGALKAMGVGMRSFGRMNESDVATDVGLGVFKWFNPSGFFLQYVKAFVTEVAYTVGSMTGLVANLLFWIGMLYAFVVPMIPFVFVMFLALGWVISILEALIAMPLWAAFFIRSDPAVVGNVERTGLMLLLNIFLRPIIGVLAVILSFYFLPMLFSLSSFLFMGAFESAIKGGGWMSIIGVIAGVAILLFIHWRIMIKIFSLIVELPERIVRWFGGQGEQTGDRDESLAVMGYLTGQVARSGMSPGRPSPSRKPKSAAAQATNTGNNGSDSDNPAGGGRGTGEKGVTA